MTAVNRGARVLVSPTESEALAWLLEAGKGDMPGIPNRENDESIL